MANYKYTKGEKLPIEVLVFEMDPKHVEEFLVADHEVWTLGEAELPGFDQIRFYRRKFGLTTRVQGE